MAELIQHVVECSSTCSASAVQSQGTGDSSSKCLYMHNTPTQCTLAHVLHHTQSSACTDTTHSSYIRSRLSPELHSSSSAVRTQGTAASAGTYCGCASHTHTVNTGAGAHIGMSNHNSKKKAIHHA